MLSHNGAGMTLTKYLCIIEKYQIYWRQGISKKGEIHGAGAFIQEKIVLKREGNWSKTLQNRINARHEKGKNWRDH